MLLHWSTVCRMGGSQLRHLARGISNALRRAISPVVALRTAPAAHISEGVATVKASRNMHASQSLSFQKIRSSE